MFIDWAPVGVRCASIRHSARVLGRFRPREGQHGAGCSACPWAGGQVGARQDLWAG